MGSWCAVVIDTTIRHELEETFKVPVKYTFVTHHHSDHASGLDAFKDTTITSSKKIATKIKDFTRVHVSPSIVFDSSYDLGEDSTIVMHKCGGHTSDSSYLYSSKENVVFAGDLIFEGYLLFAG